MAIIKIITAIIPLVICIIIRRKCEASIKWRWWRWIVEKQVAVTIIAIISGISFLILLGMEWDFYTIPHIITYIAILIILIATRGTRNAFIGNCMLVAGLVSYVVAAILYTNKYEAEKTYSSTKSYNVVWVLGEYRKVLEDGGMEDIPKPDKIYFIEDGEEAHFDEIVTDTYKVDTNKPEDQGYIVDSETTYELYIPEETSVSQ